MRTQVSQKKENPQGDEARGFSADGVDPGKGLVRSSQRIQVNSIYIVCQGAPAAGDCRNTERATLSPLRPATTDDGQYPNGERRRILPAGRQPESKFDVRMPKKVLGMRCRDNTAAVKAKGTKYVAD